MTNPESLAIIGGSAALGVFLAKMLKDSPTTGAFLTGAAIGGAAGFAIAGPPGAAVGALIGGVGMAISAMTNSKWSNVVPMALIGACAFVAAGLLVGSGVGLIALAVAGLAAGAGIAGLIDSFLPATIANGGIINLGH